MDYPDKTACIIWFAGCNMRCIYCYNVDIVKGKGRLSYEEVYSLLDKRIGLLDAVVLSGGECLMHNSIESFIVELKRRNLLVKVDTNGSYPNVLHSLISKKLIDFVALDFKALQKQFLKITKTDLFKAFDKSLDILISSGIPFEVRTSYHSKCIDTCELNDMIRYLISKKYTRPYYIQNFFEGVNTLGNLQAKSEKLQIEVLDKFDLQIVVRN